MRINGIIIVLVLFVLSGCGTAKKTIEPIQKPRQAEQKQPRPAMQTVQVDAQHFSFEPQTIPETTRIKKIRVMGASISETISLISEATGESIVFQLQSQSLNFENTGNSQNSAQDDDDESSTQEMMHESKLYFNASNLSLGKLLQKTVGNKLSVSYEQGSFYLGDVKSVTLKIPAIKQLGESIVNSLQTFGANKVVYDTVTSSISFSARTKEYEEIMHYLSVLRDNLYVIEYDMQIYSVELSDEFSLGINWEAIPSASNNLGISFESASSLGSGNAFALGVIKQSSDYASATAIMQMLEQFGTVESIQRPKLLGLAGTDVTLQDGTQESYIKSFETTFVGDSGAQTSTKSATALSGLDIKLNSNILDKTVMTKIDIDMNDIVGYTGFSINNQEYRQPKISTKKISNTVRVRPGVPIVISGLFKQKQSSRHSGVPGTSGTILNNVTGSDYESSVKSETVIIVTPRVIKYELK